MIKPGSFGSVVPTDALRMYFDFQNEQLIHLGKKIDVLFIGDSITGFWDINAYFGNEKFLVNRGIGGDCSKYLLKRFDADCIQLKPEKVVMMIGTNDISKANADLWWRVPGEDVHKVIEAYKNNISSIVQKCDAAGIELFVCSIPPSDIAPPFNKEQRWRMTADMNDFLKSLGKNYVDYHSRLCDDGKTLRYELSPDGIHLNAKGYSIMASELEKHIKKG